MKIKCPCGEMIEEHSDSCERCRRCCHCGYLPWQIKASPLMLKDLNEIQMSHRIDDKEFFGSVFVILVVSLTPTILWVIGKESLSMQFLFLPLFILPVAVPGFLLAFFKVRRNSREIIWYGGTCYFRDLGRYLDYNRSYGPGNLGYSDQTIMPKMKSKEEECRDEFRHALATDLNLAGQILKRMPQLINFPIYGDLETHGDSETYGDAETAIHLYANEGRADIVDWLLKNGADPDSLDDDDETPLHRASRLGYIDVCNVLIKGGANVNKRDFLDETPLYYASAGGHAEVVQALLAAGADPDNRDI